MTTNEIIRATSMSDGQAVRVLVESVAGYKDAYETLKGILAGLRAVHKVEVSGDKGVRAAPLEPIFEAGNIFIARAAWNELFIRHFTEFPEGSHDDVVDAVAGAYNHLNRNDGMMTFN